MELRQREGKCPECGGAFSYPLTGGGDYLQRCPSCNALLLTTRYDDGYHTCALGARKQPQLSLTTKAG